MPHTLFVCLQDEDKIAIYAMDADTGQLSLQGEAWRRTILDLTAPSALRPSIGCPRRPAPMQ